MSKESFYFQHDYNSRSDRKLVNVIMKYGMEGLGIYWCIVEMLYEEGGYLPTEYERISFELRSDNNKVESIIKDFDLFKIDTDKFWSDTALERLGKRCEKSAKARESINKRWEKYERNTNVLPSKSKRNTRKGKERKGEERKENITTRETEFKQLVFECDPLKYSQVMLGKFCDYWTEKNKSGTKMRYELEKTFEISKRLVTWANNDKQFNKTSQPETIIKRTILNGQTI